MNDLSLLYLKFFRKIKNSLTFTSNISLGGCFRSKDQKEEKK